MFMKNKTRARMHIHIIIETNTQTHNNNNIVLILSTAIAHNTVRCIPRFFLFLFSLNASAVLQQYSCIIIITAQFAIRHSGSVFPPARSLAIFYAPPHRSHHHPAVRGRYTYPGLITERCTVGGTVETFILYYYHRDSRRGKRIQYFP